MFSHSWRACARARRRPCPPQRPRRCAPTPCGRTCFGQITERSNANESQQNCKRAAMQQEPGTRHHQSAKATCIPTQCAQSVPAEPRDDRHRGLREHLVADAVRTLLHLHSSTPCHVRENKTLLVRVVGQTDQTAANLVISGLGELGLTQRLGLCTPRATQRSTQSQNKVCG